MNRINNALPSFHLAARPQIQRFNQPAITQPKDSVRFGHKPHSHETSTDHAHGPHCDHPHTHEESTPHTHDANCNHAQPKAEKNWFSRLWIGFTDDVKKFYNLISDWLKKLFSGKPKKEN